MIDAVFSCFFALLFIVYLLNIVDPLLIDLLFIIFTCCCCCFYLRALASLHSKYSHNNLCSKLFVFFPLCSPSLFCLFLFFCYLLLLLFCCCFSSSLYYECKGNSIEILRCCCFVFLIFTINSFILCRFVVVVFYFFYNLFFCCFGLIVK